MAEQGVMDQVSVSVTPAAYLGNAFKPIGYRTCYIWPGPAFQCEFNGDTADRGGYNMYTYVLAIL